MRDAGTCYIVRDVATRSGGAPAAAPTAPPADATPTRCRIAARIGGITSNEDAELEQSRGGTTITLPRDTSIAAGDWIFVGSTRYRVTSAPPLRPTDVYRAIEAEEHR